MKHEAFACFVLLLTVAFVRAEGHDDDDDGYDDDRDRRGYEHIKAVNKFNLKGGHEKQSKTESLSYEDAGFKPVLHMPQPGGGYDRTKALSSSHYKAGGNSETLTEQYLKGLGTNSKMPYVEPLPSGSKAYSNLAEKLKSNVKGSSSVGSHMGLGFGLGGVGTDNGSGSIKKHYKTSSKLKSASRSSFRSRHQSTIKGLHTGAGDQLGGGVKTYHFKKTWRSRMRAHYRYRFRSNFRTTYKTKHIVY